MKQSSTVHITTSDVAERAGHHVTMSPLSWQLLLGSGGVSKNLSEMPGLANMACADERARKRGKNEAKPIKTIKTHRVCSTLAFIWPLRCLRFCFGSASIVGSMMALEFQLRFIVMLDHVAACMLWHFQDSMNWSMIAIACNCCNCESFKIHSTCSKSE